FHVTGVQTCALPIYAGFVGGFAVVLPGDFQVLIAGDGLILGGVGEMVDGGAGELDAFDAVIAGDDRELIGAVVAADAAFVFVVKIGRASSRGAEWLW